MKNDEKILFEIFIDESVQQIKKIESDLEKIEKNFDEDIVQEIFRAVHSIKGSALSMGYEELSNFIHNLESLIAKAKNKEITFDTNLIEILYHANDKIREYINNISNNSGHKVDIERITQRIFEIIGDNNTKKVNTKVADSLIICEQVLFLMEEAVKNKENVFIAKVEIEEDVMLKNMKAFLIINNFNNIGTVIKVWPEDYDSQSDDKFNQFEVIINTNESIETVRKNIEVATEIKNIVIEKFCNVNDSSLSHFNISVQEKQKEEIYFRKIKRNYIRVNIDEINEILNKVIQLTINGEKVAKISTKLIDLYNEDENVIQLSKISQELDEISTAIQDSIVDLRVYTIKNIFERLEKLVIDLAKRSGKKIKFITKGKNLKVDRGILEEIVDPLVHIMRNSVDHGIETINERKNKDKKPYGTIELKVEHQNNYVIFEIIEDGRGYDVESIKQKAIFNNLISGEQADKMNIKELLNLVFVPGFSTAEDITDISGRGVGMDVVKTNIENLNGKINIETVKDKGSKMTIKIPLAFSIMQSVLIREGEYLLTIPTQNIEAKLSIDSKMYEKAKDNKIYTYKRSKIPAVTIGEYLGTPSKYDNNSSVIILNYEGEKFAFIVSEILPEKQLLIKSLGEYIGKGKILGNVEGISGVTILKDGSLAYLLDIPEVIESIKKCDF